MKNKIVSISGSQGCGKSTTIKLLGTEYNYANDAISIPRYVQSLHGASSLAEILCRTPKQIKTYQSDILEAKLERDLKNIEAKTELGVIIVERNFADIFAFATQWAKDSQNKDFITWVATEYKEKCIAYQKQIDYLAIMLTPLNTFEHDVRRASESSRFVIHESIMKFLDTDVDGAQEVGKWFLLGNFTAKMRAFTINREIRSRVFGVIDFPNHAF